MLNSHSFTVSKGVAIPLQVSTIILNGSASRLGMKTSTENCIYKIYVDLAERRKI